MRANYRVYLFFTSLIFVIFAAIPWINGITFKHNYTKVLKNISKDAPFTLVVRSYEMGWLTSSANLEMIFSSPSSKTFKLTMHQDISHGPFAKGRDQAWHFAKALVSSQVALEGHPVATFEIQASYWDRYTVGLQVIPFSIQTLVESQGLEGKFVVDVLDQEINAVK